METRVYNKSDKLCSLCLVQSYMQNKHYYLGYVHTCIICAWNLSRNATCPFQKGFINGGPGQASWDTKEEEELQGAT